MQSVERGGVRRGRMTLSSGSDSELTFGRWLSVGGARLRLGRQYDLRCAICELIVTSLVRPVLAPSTISRYSRERS
jgi:hypothetical protein